MSLAGLDAAAVVAAHQAALAEPSGWFLLRYVAGTRDSIEVLKRGSSGVNDARSAVEEYEEKSPLYGLIHFRRRKIVLKYVPDGTSRVLQVRLTVQFQSVLDAFTPHDTVYSFSTAPELSESALALAIMMLPSNGSPHSSSSSDRRKLNGITEDVEDPPEKKESRAYVPTTATPIEELGNNDLDELPASALRAKALLSRCKDLDASPEPVPPETTESVSSPRIESLAAAIPSPHTSPPIEKDLPAIPDHSPPQSTVVPLTSEADEHALEPSTSTEPRSGLTSAALGNTRHLSTPDSGSIAEWTTNVASFNAIKSKKKKVGPRPHVDDAAGRPRTTGNAELQAKTRPVANLPNNLRVAGTRPTTSATNYRPTSQHSSRSVPGRFSQDTRDTRQAPPPLPSPTHIASMYRPVSRASRGIPASVTSESANNATPEKLRLMKALQLRKRNQLMTQRTSASTVASAHAPSESLASTNTSNNLAEPVEAKKLMASSTASPTTLNLSEAKSTASSFTSQEEANKRRGSLSSDTSSSVTPKPTAEVEKKRKSPKKSPSRPSPRTESPEIIQPEAFAPKPATEPTSEPKTPMAPASLGVETTSRPLITRGISRSSAASRKSRGRPVPDSLTLGYSDMDELSEEEYDMDELENATVQEAKPVQMVGTPVTPTLSKITAFSREAGRSASTPIQTRPYTQPKPRNPSSDSLEKPKSAGGRSISTALPHWPPTSETPPLPLTTKSTVGTGISKRIKALEGFTTRQSTSPPRQPAKADFTTRSAFSKFLKRSSLIVDPHQVPNTSTETSPPKKPLSASKELPAAPLKPWVQRQGSEAQVYHPTQKGETVSVTARIIRDENEEFRPSQSEFGDVNLYQSPLIVEHERQIDDHSSIRTMTAKRPEREPGRFSFSSQRLHTSDSFASKLSITGTGRKQLPKSVSDNSSLNAEERGKPSRAGRLMKRVSNLAAMRGNRKTAGILKSSSSVITFDQHQHHPDTIEERVEPDTRPLVSDSLLHVVDIGDVNVQFPESLLWKRRFIRIDDQGFLIFSPPANESNTRAVSRKFHLNDFRVPVVPDVEREEMAWSIVMDLKDGRSLQCACASRAGQIQVLQMLVDAHNAYQQLYG